MDVFVKRGFLWWVSYYTILDYTILYYTILYYTILYYTIPYYTILYYTLLYIRAALVGVYEEAVAEARLILDPPKHRRGIYWICLSARALLDRPKGFMKLYVMNGP